MYTQQLLDAESQLGKEMLYSLSKEVFRMSRLRTPLLEQDPHPTNFFATRYTYTSTYTHTLEV
jgi:hypothetical protein